MVAPKTILSIDIGTSSLKAGLIDESGSLLAFERERFVKEKPASMWLDAFCMCAKKIFQEQKHNPPSAISISGNGPTLAFLHKTKEGKNTADILLWNEEIFENAEKKSIQNEYQGSSLFIPRILAYFASFSGSIKTIEKLRSIQKIFSGPEYLVWQLTGVAHTLLPEPRFQPAYWTDEELKSYGITKHLLPPFIQLGKQSGKLEKSFYSIFSKDISLNETLNIPVFCAGPDFTSAIIGTNTLEPGRICDRAGSSEGFNLCTNWPLFSAIPEENSPIYTQIRNLPSVISPFFNASTLIPDSGTRFSQVKRQSSFAKKSYTEYVEYLLKNQDDDGYKIMLELAKECKIAFDILYESYTDKLLKEGFDKKIKRKVVVTGGQAKNEAWLKLKANIMNIEIDIPECLDAELIGNASIAFWGLGFFTSVDKAAQKLCKIKKTIYSQE